ncbi:MAG TPA: N-acetylmuramoyl-L-alanine amidase [Candidatus Babeliales bacterium]|nr:N-acetylmuramoyl-L-alanine amidase [Candidatus Babeliales bacterium]
MSKIIENFLIPLFVVVSVLYAFNSFGNDGICLNKVFHHMAHNDAYLERANVSLYFSGDPHVQEIKNKKLHDSTSCTFFFPKAVISSGECEAMVNRINNHNDVYKVTITEVVKPTKGVVVAFVVDPNKFAVDYEQFDSIGLQKGIVFRLYNKELLKKLEQANNQPVLRTLWYSPSDLYGAPGVEKRSWGRDKPCIVIDPGHGGLDCGAIGHGGIQEKQVCLAIGTAVGNLLQQHGCSVVLTRHNDCDMQLDERTSYANDINADMFVSIHANYAASPRAVGVETFCMQPQLLKKKISHVSSEQDLCIAHIMNHRADFSHKLAQSVQRHVCDAVSQFHDESIDRKVKHSISQVLLGTQMPAVLVEVGFLSHKKEALLLNDVQYQNCVAHGICNGILSAIRF